jgi:hypothetical protein
MDLLNKIFNIPRRNEFSSTLTLVEKMIKVPVLHEKGGDDYQGTYTVIIKNPDKEQYYILGFNYGSCGGCDEWISYDNFKDHDDKELDEMITEYGQRVLEYASAYNTLEEALKKYNESN